MTQGQPSAGQGAFSARVYTANQALPIPDAEVAIFFGAESTPRHTLHTNRAGETEKLLLSAPPADRSRSPGSVSATFTDYRVTVKAEGFYHLLVEHVPIFAETSTVLPAALIPLAAYNSANVFPANEIITVTQSPQALFQSTEEKE